MQCVETRQHVQGGHSNRSSCDPGAIGTEDFHFLGYGPDLRPGLGSTCPLYDEDGYAQGTQTTTAVNIGTPSAKFHYIFDLDDGSHLEMKNIPGITVFLPINQAANSYPSKLAPYLNDPNYALIIFASESNKGETHTRLAGA